MRIEKGDDHVVIRNSLWPAITSAISFCSVGVALLLSEGPGMKAVFVGCCALGVACFFVTRPAVAFVSIDTKNGLVRLRRTSLLRPLVDQIPTSSVTYIEVERSSDSEGWTISSVYIWLKTGERLHLTSFSSHEEASGLRDAIKHALGR
jgi:hypothetical protein